MSAGVPLTRVQVDQILTSLAIQIRNACDSIRVQYTPIGTAGATGLQNLPAGPGATQYTAAEAAQVLQLFGYLNNVAAVYYGTGTQPSASNFDQALSVVWAGQ